MPKRKKLFALFCVIVAVCAPLFTVTSAFSDTLDTSSSNLDSINKQLADLTDALNKSVEATKPLQSQLESMQHQIESIKAKVAQVEVDAVVKKKEIDNGYKALGEKEQLISKTIRDFYVKSYYDSPLLVFVSAATASEMTQTLAYQRAKTEQDKAIITNIALSITDLEEKKRELEEEQQWLMSTKANLDQQSKKLDEVVTGALAYQKDLSGKIQQLSAQQQSILNARSGTFTATLGDSDQADDYNASIKGFREAAPAGSFAAFSFGAYTHRKGMSQYGAYGRANSGQDYKAILKAYYGKDVSTADTGGTIDVQGVGAIDFEGQYLLGIAEMPSSFPMEALKAQAVAARTYAYRYKQNGQSICTTESCQVYNAGKAANPPDAWRQAVEATKGQVIDGVVTYFASTAGGYLTTSGWDTTDGNGGSNFADRAYEKIAGSPWFYKAWYTKGYSVSSDKCGRTSPWLTGSEMADIINASYILANGSGEETNRVTPPSTNCWGGNPYSSDEILRISDKYGGGVSSVSSVSVLQGNGTTNEVVFQTDKGEKHISGSSFKTAFNLRAPGYLSIPQSGFAFFNIEHK
jgi:peptidoglycan hydrolase-like amidase